MTYLVCQLQMCWHNPTFPFCLLCKVAEKFCEYFLFAIWHQSFVIRSHLRDIAGGKGIASWIECTPFGRLLPCAVFPTLAHHLQNASYIVLQEASLMESLVINSFFQKPASQISGNLQKFSPLSIYAYPSMIWISVQARRMAQEADSGYTFHLILTLAIMITVLHIM